MQIKSLGFWLAMTLSQELPNTAHSVHCRFCSGWEFLSTKSKQAKVSETMQSSKGNIKTWSFEMLLKWCPGGKGGTPYKAYTGRLCPKGVPFSGFRYMTMIRSSAKSLLFVPKVNCSTLGDQAFARAAPALWNSLPLTIRTSSSLAIFKKQLKTYLFKKAFNLLE